MADFDGVSLYPSSMVRLSNDLGGYLKGSPKVIQPHQLNRTFLDSVDGYFLEVEVTKVGINRAFPILSYIDEATGTRNFCNQEMVGRVIAIDKIALEDGETFQGAEYRLIRGYYFDEGRDPTIGSVMERLFNERLKKKKEGNPIQEVYKLIMNSGYGRTLLKPIESTSMIANEAEKENQISLNFNSIKEITPLRSGNFLIKKWKPINDHFNSVHLGVEVLSMSKRIMAEVMCLAEDLGMQIMITDTDSMHIPEKHLPALRDAFRVKYGRELVGKLLGQFHTDFDIYEPVLNEQGQRIGSGGKVSASDIYAEESYFLGKKCYIDRLIGTGADGQRLTDYHIRMKGVPNASIWHRANQDFGGDPMLIYKALFEGESIEFDLTCGGDKCSFEFGKNFTVTSRTKFLRRVRFTGADLAVTDE